ncbi:efflux RND transporter permease subunit [Clostridium sp. BL-8]|uniref:efflux RND transporter permease subunit n=1 Tax=Clostridium sp. BL-8 TaxID=349938 RepID=UPI00098C5102|nr:efflux RND transporter permease subunit [Clostridium sp. BL-8]OOM77185.1 multidrug resistance protein MdtC [Clostridium sp. BL-8]
MKITELAVKKPLSIIIVVALIMGLGIFGYANLGADLFPAIDAPVITITTTYSGAGTKEIEENVTKPIEDAVSGISGIDTLKSGSVEGYGYTIIKFTMNTDMNSAFMDVQQALGDISNKLPEGASKPVIKKADKNAAPVMMISVSSSLPYGELYNAADDIQKSLEKISGVGEVTLEGAVQKELMIDVDKTSMEQYGISINTIVSKLQSENVNIPAGQLKQENSKETMRVLGEFQNIEDIENIQIPMTNGGTIRLKDIADIKLDYPDESELVRLNGESSIGIFVKKQSDANIVETTKAVKEELKSIEKTLPSGINVSIADDSSTFINESLSEVKIGLIEGIITTSVIMFLFLKSIKSSLIVLVAIPTSLLATFFMMYVFNFTLNMLSLLALSLSIGILVDDSIVVLENIQRHLSQGKGLIRAAIDGRDEIGMAAISITLCDIVVFGPVAFMSGMVGQFFRQFGLTVIFATIFSLIVSFTLTPMLASRLLKEKKDDIDSNDHKVEAKKGFMTRLFDKVNEEYKRFLLWSLDNRWKVVSIVMVMFTLSILLIPFKAIKTEFLPTTDQSKFTINVDLSPGSDIADTDEKVKELEEHLKSVPEVSEYFTVIGSDNESSATINVDLKEKSKRKKSQGEVAQEIREWSKSLTGVDVSVNESNGLSQDNGDGAKPIAINIIGPNVEVLKDLGDKTESMVKDIKGTTDVSNSMKANENEIDVEVDRTAAAQFGIKPSDIAGALKAASNQGTDAGVYRKDGDEYDMTVKFQDGQVKTKDQMSSIMIANPSGTQVPLDQVAKVSLGDSPQEQLRMDRDEMVTIYANVQGRTVGSVNTDIKKAIENEDMPTGYEVTYGGDQQNMATSFKSLIEALAVSIVLVYMILVVLYESWLTPFLRMLSLPCGMIGALIALVITRNTLNIVTMIGLIMLDGLASKNGTLLIDYTNTLMKRGMPLREALIESGSTRLRPIMMTTITMIVGMLPTALAMGQGSEYRSGMSIALIGGMITSTILSPVLIPVVYTLIDDMKKRILERRNSKKGAANKL